METAHAKFSASSAHRWFACPGSLRLCEGIPRATSQYAAEGTLAHSVGERALRERRPASAFIGETVEVDGYTFTVTAEMASAVQVYVDTVLDDYKRLSPCTMSIERRFNLDHLHPDMFGTNDASLLAEFDRLVVYDYKHGAGVPISPENNPQFMFYALGALRGVDAPVVEIVVVQPRCRGEAVKRWETTAEDIEAWGREVLLPKALACLAPDAPLVPGEEQCRFCAAKAVCPALREAATSMAVRAFGADPVVPETKDITLPAVADLTPDQLGRALSLAKILDVWFNAVEERAKSDIAAGKPVTGYKLVERAGIRKWAEDDRAAKALKNYTRDIYDTKLRSPAAMEKVLKAAGYPKDAIQDMYAVLVVTSRGVTLVPESDKRPAVPPDAALVFGSVEEE